MFEKLDGFFGLLVYRTFGCVAAIMTALSLWAVYQSVVQWDGWTSVITFVMFGFGAGLAGWCTKYCFSRDRRFSEFAAAADSDAD